MRRVFRGDNGWLKHWLESLQIAIPDVNATLYPYDISIRDGLCTKLDLDSITSTKSGKKLTLDVAGLAIQCDLRYVAKSRWGRLFDASGSVVAEVSRSKVAASLLLRADSGTYPPLPSAIEANSKDCRKGTKIDVTKLEFPDASGALAKVVQAFRGLVEDILTRELGSVMCEQLGDVISSKGSEALRNASGVVRKFLSESPTSPPPPELSPGHSGGVVDISANAGTKLVSGLLANVLSNTSSPHSLDSLLSAALGPDGDLSLSFSGILPISNFFVLPDLGSINVTVNALHFGELNTVSKLAVDATAPQEISTAFGMHRLIADVSITLVAEPDDAHPSPLHGEKLVESFDVSVSLSDFGASAAFLLALNGTHLGALTAEQLASPGCLLPGLISPMVMSAGLKMSLVQPTVSPSKASASGLERDVDGLIDIVLHDLFSDYAPALEAVGNHALSVTLRDAINAALANLTADPGQCAPPSPTYASEGLSDFCFVAALVVLATAVAVLFLGSAIERVLRPRSTQAPVASKPRDPRAAPLTEDGPVAALAAEVEATAAAAAAEEEHEEEEEERLSSLALFRHPRLPLPVRVGLPLLVVPTILLFVSANSGIGAEVRASVTLEGEEVVALPPMFSFSLVSSVKDMWDGGVYPLAFLIAGFSGVWPYAKLLLMLACWFAPPSRLSVQRRQGLYDFLDAYGKWSLVDTFVLVLFMVAFRFDLSGLGNDFPEVVAMFEELGMDAKLTVYIVATRGFHSFLIATVFSLVVGHGMTACHRRALKIGEYGETEENTGREVLAGGRRRLCNILRPAGRFEGRFFAYGPALAVAVSLVLVLAGTFMDTFQFKFLGLAGFVLGPEASIRPFSIITLGEALPEASNMPDSFATKWIQSAFLFFAAVVMPVYLSIILCLWTAPLSNRIQKHFLVAAQVLNAWSGLDVFCMSVMACVLQIRQFAIFIVGDKCDLIDALAVRSPLADRIPGPKTCFDVDSELRPGFYVLAVAAIIALVTGQITLSRCSGALLAGRGSLRAPAASTPTGARNVVARGGHGGGAADAAAP